MVFYTTDGNASQSEVMRLTADAGTEFTGAVDVTGDLTVATLTADGDTAAGDNATIGYTASEGLILTGQGSTDDITIKNDADTTVLNVATGTSDIEISAGDIIFGTSGKGINLGVTSNTDANTLDDYEEGTWTAALVAGASLSMSVNVGYYTKIGNLVTVTGYIATTGLNGASGSLFMNGLPFTAVDNDGAYSGCAAGYGDDYAITAGTTVAYNVAGNASRLTLRVWSEVTGISAMTAAQWSDNGKIMIGLTYRAA
jgi:hypothetical protein